jgi:putative cardiolipin synthase
MSPARIPWLMRALSALARWFPGSWLFLLVGRARLRAAPKPGSRALGVVPDSALAARLAALRAGHGEQTGCLLLEDGAEALMVRCALADAATAGIDVQYYAYEADLAGLVLTQRLTRAAERGVRVRILIDDVHLHRAERHLVELDAHPLIEVRSFNPTPERRGLARVLRFLMQMERLNRRMHDKAFVVDAALAVVGGRNIGDAYFGARAETFRDLDLFLLGPLAGQVAAAFDATWNSAHAVPIAAFRPADLAPELATRRATKLDARLARRLPDLPARYARARLALERWSGEGEALLWATGAVLAESPERVAGTHSQVIGPALLAVLAAAEHEVLIETAYFVPSPALLDALCGLPARGVRVKVLTNSLASTDVPAVHAGYAPHRARLIAAGVELHEFRARRRGIAALWSRATRETVLHTKALVVDRARVWLGSANLDPRSAWFNTELGVLVESEALALRLTRHVLQDCEPPHAWRVEADADAPLGLSWTGEVAGRAVTRTREPDASALRRLKVRLVAWIPGHADFL